VIDHPNPTLRRAWRSLDGPWQFSIGERSLDREICVPYAPETPASGIGHDGRVERCWYRRVEQVEDPGPGHRLVAHFGAVDRFATVWAGGSRVGEHEGGYTPFSVDVTEGVRDGALELVVRADDPSLDLEAPRGKQEWQDRPHAIWYPRTTGIWRTPWVERVPDCSIASLRWGGDAAMCTVTLHARIDGEVRRGTRLAVRLGAHGRELVDDSIAVLGPDVERTFAVGGGGIDDRTALLWWPRRPNLLDAEVALVDADGNVIDRVESYTGLRDVRVDDGHVLVNGRPTMMRLVLDQGYWPETGLTPPDVAAMQTDIDLALSMGFNGVRKHQKVEDPRFLAAADRAGLLVWLEMPSVYRFGDAAAARLLREWVEVVRMGANHPSVVVHVPFNESWGVPDLENDARQRALIDALVNAARATDGTRPVSSNDGWETIGGDILGIHDYTRDASVLRDRYGSRTSIATLLEGRRSDGKLASVDRSPLGRRALVLSEFGGIALAEDTGGAGWSSQSVVPWGYHAARSPEDLLDRYREMWRAVHDSDVLAGACWTQLTDTYQEVNGLLRFDRAPKVPVEEIAAATRGRPRIEG
jgi:beta-galactosidase/beta-glucuronidase